MTGFGQVSGDITGKKITVEVRTLNSKGFDANLRLPAKFREIEPAVRTLLGNRLERGKVDYYLTVVGENEFSDYTINHNLALHYLNEIKSLSDETGLSLSQDLLPVILRLPDVISQPATGSNEQDQKEILSLTEEAIKKTDEFRVQEGNVLESDLRLRITAILNLLSGINPFEQQRIEDIRKRLNADLVHLEGRVNIDSNRFEQEIIYYLERIDFTEEKVRLSKHCNEFLSTLSNEKSQGRKLGFIAQEIGREINTLGSKAYNADIQKIVIEMKNELEKVKEQLLNVL